MSLNGKYSLGILLTFVLLAVVMMYTFPLIGFITGIRSLTAVSFFYTRMVFWIVLGLVILYSHYIEKSSITLWKDKKYSVAFYVGSVICLYFICAFGSGFLNLLIKMATQEKTSGKLIQMHSIFKNNYFLIIFTCLTAGVVEEFLMRGYIQTRIEKIYKSPFLGIAVSSVLFGILHSTYGTIVQVVGPLFIGIVFALFYKRYSNIKIIIMCHFLYDFVSLMMMNFIDIKHLSAFLPL
ncbi:CPBP family intramembrane metalloprotease [Chryseobacterium soli]|uniref:CPBP family intramembrane glutamic endopeptidase n=1 Tax=Chryseobacterium soli TaxID=445961 RepID=UPI0029533815|nr:type II CAAX endopeptidase family protein [Chryseobacterium soli]MDV7699353.1 CPBP family intramembrane metalloprotease [Chryseobacterium soli]